MTVIAVVSQKGGAGKTTLAIHLAMSAEKDGKIALIIDTDPQGTASQWADWRKDAPPEVIDSTPVRIAKKIEDAKAKGAEFIVIDTPPHASTIATEAVKVADLVLIPCRPSGFDLVAAKTTIQLVQNYKAPAFAIFTAGSPNAPRLYEEASELIESYGIAPCPVIIPDRAIYRHATTQGQTVYEAEPNGKAAKDCEQLYKWTCQHVIKSTTKENRKAVA